MNILDRLFGQRKMSDGKEIGKATQGGHGRAIPKLVIVLGMLAFVLSLSSITSPPAGRIAIIGGRVSTVFAAGSSGKMYWAENALDRVQRANLDGTGVEHLVTGSGAPVGIALDLASDKMYWTNNIAGTIQRANLDGTGVEGLVTGVSNLAGIALDLAGGKMYFLGGTDRTIQRANLDGTSVEELVGGPSGKNFIALDLGGGKMYWTDATFDRIQRANLDGTGVETLVMGVPGPSGIALDLAGGKMYWAENALGKIQRANLDGTGVEDLATEVHRPVGIALDLAGGKMYWTNNVAGKIQQANLDGTGIEDLVTGLSIPQGIALDISISYDFDGFFPPVDNLPAINDVKAGKAIPVKFSLNGDQGLNIFDVGFPASQQIACDASATPDVIEETVTAGSSSLSYDATIDQYVYVWKTDKGWAGTCRQLIVQLNDGTIHVAYFNFR